MTTMTTTFEPGTLYHVPPGQLLLERNIREATPSPELIASVEQVGVLEPITAVLNGAGDLVVRFGHRRTMAAVAANVTPVPVYVAARDDLSDTAEIDRITCQRDENTHRVGLSAADEIGIVEQYSAFGMTAAQIAQQARVKRSTVDTAMAVSESKLARKAAAKYADLTLDQAAAVAEFEDDPKTAQALIVVALDQPHAFAHKLQRERDDRKHAELRAAAIAKLTAAGVTIVDEPNHYGSVQAYRLHRLVDAKTGKPITPAGHKKCPGHVAWVTHRAEPEYGCTAPAKNGHRDTYASSSKPAAADMTDTEREKAKAERRLVIDNNKAWDSAQTVRRGWLKILAQHGKSAPKGAAAFIAQAIGVDAGHILNQVGSDKYAAEWLGSKQGTYGTSPVADLAAGATDARALHLLLVMVLSAYEDHTDRGDWRRDGKTTATGRYLAFLATCGYDLSDVEKYACNSKTV